MGIFFHIMISTNFAILLEDSPNFLFGKTEKENSTDRRGTVS
jgi:hypothetical protein